MVFTITDFSLNRHHREELNQHPLDYGRLIRISFLLLFRSLNSLVLRGSLDSNMTECLLKIPFSLKRLELKSFLIRNKSRAHELPTLPYKLLQKHCLTLENLDLRLGFGTKDIEWKFPAFPALKRLRIYFCTKFQNFGFESPPGSGSFGRIDYKACVPALEIFHIHSFDFPSFAAFIPPEDNTCPVIKSVREVDINLFRCKQPNEEAQAALQTRLLEVFFNAEISIIIP